MCSTSLLLSNHQTQRPKIEHKCVSRHVSCSFFSISKYIRVLSHVLQLRIVFAFTVPYRHQLCQAPSPFLGNLQLIPENNGVTVINGRIKDSSGTLFYGYTAFPRTSSLYIQHDSTNENKSINAYGGNLSRVEDKNNDLLTSEKIRSYAVNINRLRKGELGKHSATPVSSKKATKSRQNAPIATTRSFVNALQRETINLRSLIDIYLTKGLPEARDWFGRQHNTQIFANQQALSVFSDSFNYATIQSIRAFADAGDFIGILKVIDTAVDYATAFAITTKIANIQTSNNNIEASILQPRIFGEAISGLAKGTKASTSKCRHVWNTMISLAESKKKLEDNFVTEKLRHWLHAKEKKIHIIDAKHSDVISVSILNGLPSAFELNSMINALAGQNKIRAALNLFIDVTKTDKQILEVGKVSGDSMKIAPIDIDAYTASSLFNMLAESIAEPDPAIINDVYVPNSLWYGRKGSQNKRKKDNIQRESPCWQWREALNILDSILKAWKNNRHDGDAQENVEKYLNNHVFSALLKVNENASELFNSLENKHDGAQAAMGILQIMRKIKINPDVIVCSAVMSAFDKGQQWKAAISLFNAMEKDYHEQLTREKDNENIWALPAPNVYTYAAAISACARSGEGEAALLLLNKMKNTRNVGDVDDNGIRFDEPNITVSPNKWVYNSALAACAYSKNSNITDGGDSRLDMALKIIDQMEEDSLNGYDTAPDTVSFNTALGAVGGFKNVYKDKNGDVVCTFINEDENFSAKSMTALLGNEEVIVLDLLNKMKEKSLPRDSITYRNAIFACRSRPEAVLRILDQALNDDDFLKSIENGHVLKWRGKVYVMNAALSAFAFNGDTFSMAKIFKTFKEHNVEANVNSISQIIRSLGVSGDIYDMMLVLNAMKGDSVHNDQFNKKYGIDIIENIGVMCPMIDETHYSAAITTALKKGELFLAIKVLHAMRLHGLNPSETSLHAIIFAYCKLALDMSSKEAKEARKKATKRRGKSYKIRIEYNMSYARANAAYTMMQTLNKPSPKLQAAVSISCAAAGMWSEARRILRGMHKTSLTEIKMENFNEPTLSTQGSTVAELPNLHRSLLKLCARNGNVTAALWYIDDIQKQSLRLESKENSDSETSVHHNGQSQNKSIMGEITSEDNNHNFDKLSNTTCLVRGIGMTGEDWKLLMIAASKSSHWRVCLGTLQFIRPFIEETNPNNLRVSEFSNKVNRDEEVLKLNPSKSLKSLDRQYEKLARALTAAILCFETRSQYAWAVRAIYDWIDWSGRRPRKEAVFSACRLLARRGKCSQVVSLVKTVIDVELHHLGKSNRKSDFIPNYEESYERAVYTEAISALYSNGFYDTADELYASAVYEGYLPWPVIEQKNQSSQLKIDLHGMNRALAHSAVRVALQQEIQATSWNINDAKFQSETLPILDRDVIIVTGKGKRSAQHLRPVLRPEVQRMLLEEFYPPLGTSSVPGNMGALTIPFSDVNSWLEHQKEQKGIRLLAVAGILKNISSGDRLKRLLAIKMKENIDGESDDSNNLQ